MFACNENGSGFHISFANGWTVSVQWGPNTYSSNNGERLDFTFLECSNAEVAAWDVNGKWWKHEMKEVMGFVSPEQVAGFISMISKLPSESQQDT